MQRALLSFLRLVMDLQQKTGQKVKHILNN